ncbi:MAG: WD40 repeat domain-containing protein, partial [Pseudomonadota bacterium]
IRSCPENFLRLIRNGRAGDLIRRLSGYDRGALPGLMSSWCIPGAGLWFYEDKRGLHEDMVLLRALIVANRCLGDAKLVDGETGKEIRRLPTDFDKLNLLAVFSPDGSRFATGGSNNTVIVWDSATGSLLGVMHGHTEPVKWAQFSADGSQLLTMGGKGDVCYQREARIWNLGYNGQEVASISLDKPLSILPLFSPDGRRFITADPGHQLNVWSVPTPTQQDAPFEPSLQRVLPVSVPEYADMPWAFSPCGKHMAIMKSNGCLTVRDAETFDPIGNDIELERLDRWSSQVNLSFSHSKVKPLLAINWAGQTRLYDLGAKRLSGLPATERTFCSRPARFSRDDTLLATQSYPGGGESVMIWDIRSHNLTRQIKLRKAVPTENILVRMNCNDLSTRDDLMVVGFEGSAAKVPVVVLDIRSGQHRTYLQGHTGGVTDARYSPDKGEFIATAGHDRTVRIWNASSGGPSIHTLVGHSDFVRSARFSSDDSRVVSVSNDGTARMWDVREGKPLAVYEPSSGFKDALREEVYDTLSHAMFSPDRDSKWIIASSLNGRVRLYPGSYRCMMEIACRLLRHAPEADQICEECKPFRE